jgi:outer membrane receptor protein involved in Fe transport
MMQQGRAFIVASALLAFALLSGARNPVAAGTTDPLPLPSPSPSSSPPATIGTVRVATGAASALHQLPVTAAAIDAQTISNTNGSLDAALRALPGFDRTRANGTFSNYGLDRLSISGAGTDRAGLLVDGVPGLDPFGGQVDWAALPAAAITRAEVLLGPGSALYGSGAIGGALDLRTFSAADVGTTAFAAPSFTIGGISQESSLLVGVPAGDWKFGAWADTSRTTFGALSPAYTYAQSTAATTVTGTARATAQYSHGDLTLDLGALAGTDAQNEGRPNYTFSRNLNQADLALTLGHGTTSETFRTFDRDFKLFNSSDTFPSAPGKLLYTQTVPSSDSGYSLDVVHASANATLLVRAETRVARGESTQVSATDTIQNAGGGTERTDALVVEDDARFGRLRLLAGARVDDVFTNAAIAGSAGVARADAAVSPRVALSWSLVPDLTIRAYAGTGLRTPFLNELVRGYRIGAIQYNPNLQLLPERSRSGGVGLDYASGATHATFDFQSTAVFNAIDFRTLSPTVQIRSNVGATRTDGVQFTLQHAVACGVVDVSASGHYARITADVDRSLLGERIPYVPNESVSAGWSGGRAVVASARITYVGQSYADDRNTMSLPPATLLDLSLSRPLAWGALTVGVSNAGNAVYLSSPDRLAPPSNVWFRISTGRPGGLRRDRCER